MSSISWRQIDDTCQVCKQPLDAHENPWDCAGNDPGAEDWLLGNAQAEQR